MRSKNPSQTFTLQKKSGMTHYLHRLHKKRLYFSSTHVAPKIPKTGSGTASIETTARRKLQLHKRILDRTTPTVTSTGAIACTSLLAAMQRHAWWKCVKELTKIATRKKPIPGLPTTTSKPAPMRRIRSLCYLNVTIICGHYILRNFAIRKTYPQNFYQRIRHSQ